MKDRDLCVKVMKAGCDLRLPRSADGNPSKVHTDRAAEWLLPVSIRIHAVSIPEQSEVSIYADIEVSTASKMYMMEGHIFRVKYAGPAIKRNPPEPTFTGSNITTTNITFPAGVSIPVTAGQLIYVHLDVINHSPFEVYPMTQDVYIYYTIEQTDQASLDRAPDPRC